MQDKPVAPVTGSNEGLGLQIAKDLAAYGSAVLVGLRNPKNGETAARSIEDDARAIAKSPDRSRAEVVESGRPSAAFLDAVRSVMQFTPLVAATAAPEPHFSTPED